MTPRILPFLAAAAVLCLPRIALAAPCSIEMDSNDAMQFDRKTVVVPVSCKTFTVQLRHTGKLPRTVMGHNWVLSESAAVKAVAADGIAAGIAHQYVKPGDARVIAASRIIGGGETDSVSFETSKLRPGTEYSYFCSFPGHSTLMVGQLSLGR